MSTFESKVVKIDAVEHHPNADRLDLVVVGGYRSIVQRDGYTPGDLVAYIPEAAIVPDDVLETLNLTGKLAGSRKNRVKAIRLRDIISQGLIHPLNMGRLQNHSLKENDDVTEILGLVKYVPEIPTNMGGELEPGPEYTVKYDIENIKKFPDRIQSNDKVVMTEKIHGTFMCAGYYAVNHDWRVSSKGLGAKGLVFKNNEANENNLYVKTFNNCKDSFNTFKETVLEHGDYVSIHVLGEVYGRGVQDLHYGSQDKKFILFDVCCRQSDGTYHYLDWPNLCAFAEKSGFDVVPQVYVGVLKDIDPNGNSALCDSQIREGLVIKTFHETVRNGERCIVKSVSDDYLMRKGATEYE